MNTYKPSNQRFNIVLQLHRVVIKLLKKLFFIGCLVLVLASCNKVGQCYNCTYGAYNGYTKPADTYCGDLSKYKPKANDGGELSFWCQPK